jgi:hypothetical protein
MLPNAIEKFINVVNSNSRFLLACALLLKERDAPCQDRQDCAAQAHHVYARPLG